MTHFKVIEGGARGGEHGKAIHSLYMWKVQNPHRRVVIELNAIATEGSDPPVEITLLGSDADANFTGYGKSLPEAVNDALSKDGSGR